MAVAPFQGRPSDQRNRPSREVSDFRGRISSSSFQMASDAHRQAGGGTRDETQAMHRAGGAMGDELGKGPLQAVTAEQRATMTGGSSREVPQPDCRGDLAAAAVGGNRTHARAQAREIRASGEFPGSAFSHFDPGPPSRASRPRPGRSFDIPVPDPLDAPPSRGGYSAAGRFPRLRRCD
jgi:hypothetical protein